MALIQIKQVIHFVVGQIDVRQAIAVEIGDDDAQSLALLEGVRSKNAGLLAYVRERAVAVVPVENVRQRFKSLGRTNVRRLVGFVGARRVFLERPVDVMADVQIREPVAVQVGESGARAPEVIIQAGFLGDVDKASPAFAVRFVMKERDAAPAGDQQVRPAVIVVIRHGAAMGIKPVDVQAHLGGHVFELPVAQVLIELAGMSLDLLFVRAVIVAAARHKNVQEAVLIVVDESDAPAQRFHNGQVAGFLTVVIAEVDAGIGGAVGENGLGRRRCFRRRRRRVAMTGTAHE